MRNSIILGDDPFSAEYWEKNGRLLHAIESLAEGRDGPYLQYWMSRTRGTRDSGKAYVKGRFELLNSIRRGYEPDAWKSDPNRKPDWPERGFGPITVSIGPTGKIYSRDGSHRACMLRVLGRPVEAEVFQRHEYWQQIVAKRPYTPYPHPDFDGVKPVRSGCDRLAAIERVLAGCVDKPIFIVGAAIGYEAEYFLRAGFEVEGCEPDEYRHTMLTSLLERLDYDPRPFFRGTADCFSYAGYDAIVAMSVLHHAATSLARWQQLADQLAVCPRIFFELPGLGCDRWHAAFKAEAEARDKHPATLLFETLVAAGGYTQMSTLCVDHNYDGRALRYLAR